MPESMYYQWKAFLDLHNARTSTGYSINPITYSDILAYSVLMKLDLEEWEIELIKALDNVAMNAYAEEAKKEHQKSKSKK